MNPAKPTLGTLLRHLIELTESDVEAVYRGLGLDYRPRFTPLVRALVETGPMPIRALANAAGVTHSAASQTISEMERRGLVSLQPGLDARQRVVTLTPKAVAMMPELRSCWAATNAAAAELDRELEVPLAALLADAVARLEQRPFLDRILSARADLEKASAPASPAPSLQE